MRDGRSTSDWRIGVSAIPEYVKERINTMSESLIDLVFSEEETLSDESPDAALEVAAGNCWAHAGNPFTFAFCTGLDTCSRR